MTIALSPKALSSNVSASASAQDSGRQMPWCGWMHAIADISSKKKFPANFCVVVKDHPHLHYAIPSDHDSWFMSSFCELEALVCAGEVVRLVNESGVLSVEEVIRASEYPMEKEDRWSCDRIVRINDPVDSDEESVRHKDTMSLVYEATTLNELRCLDTKVRIIEEDPVQNASHWLSWLTLNWLNQTCYCENKGKSRRHRHDRYCDMSERSWICLHQETSWSSLSVLSFHSWQCDYTCNYVWIPWTLLRLETRLIKWGNDGNTASDNPLKVQCRIQ